MSNFIAEVKLLCSSVSDNENCNANVKSELNSKYGDYFYTLS